MPNVERTRTTAQATKEGLRLFLAGLAWHVDETILHRDFGECGLIEDLFLMRDPGGQSKGRALVTFRDKEGADAALAFNNTDYGGRKLYVKVAEEKRGQPSTEGGGQPSAADGGEQPAGEKKPKKQEEAPVEDETIKPEGCVSLCFKNLAHEASETDVRGLLSGCQVQSVRVVFDRVTGESRGVAFVDFVTTEDVDKAMAFDGKNLCGRPVVMKYEKVKVRPRPEGCMSVVVKKLGPDTAEADIYKLFKGLAKSLTDCRVIIDPATKQCSGLAFVDFSKEKSAETAVSRSGMKVNGNTVFIGYETKSKKERDAAMDKGDKSKANKKKKSEAPEVDFGFEDGDAGAATKKAKKSKKKAEVQDDEAEPDIDQWLQAKLGPGKAAEEEGAAEQKKKKKKKKAVDEEAAAEEAPAEPKKKRKKTGAAEDAAAEEVAAPVEPKKKKKKKAALAAV